MPQSRREAYVWEDMVTGKHFFVNNENGDHVACDRGGNVLPICRVGVSGVADTKARMLDFKTKGDIFGEALKRGREPLRPGPLPDEKRNERVETKGRYRMRPVSESELWMREARLQKTLNPERFDTERAAEAKHRKKVEEARRNFRALEKEFGAKAGGIGGYESKPFKAITRKDLEPYMNMPPEDCMPIEGRVDEFGLYRP